MNSNIIGVCGKANSGKDTVARYLVREHEFKHMSLAAPIKDFAGFVFGFSEDQLWGSSSKREQVIHVDWKKAHNRLEDKADEWLGFFQAVDKFDELDNMFRFIHSKYRNTVSARVVLQLLGTDFGRTHLGDNVWIDHLLRQASQYTNSGQFKGVVVSDVRFLNEVHAIKNVRGRVIKLLRNSDKEGTGIVGHSSETEQDSIPTNLYDCVLKNQDTIKDLENAVNTFCVCCCNGD